MSDDEPQKVLITDKFKKDFSMLKEEMHFGVEEQAHSVADSPDGQILRARMLQFAHLTAMAFFDLQSVVPDEDNAPQRLYSAPNAYLKEKNERMESLFRAGVSQIIKKRKQHARRLEDSVRLKVGSGKPTLVKLSSGKLEPADLFFEREVDSAMNELNAKLQELASLQATLTRSAKKFRQYFEEPSARRSGD